MKSPSKYIKGTNAELYLIEPQPCRDCGSSDTTLMADPYAQDVENTLILVWLCERCADERAAEI
jgi:hypothetical protein